LLHLELIQSMRAAMAAAGFPRQHTLNFPQPVYPSGWWSATMALKSGGAADYRQQDVANLGFETRYYNADIHSACLAQPEFFKSAFG
ncbi:MAG: polyamine aminopropyltransferase, partial [Gammaproteobacteria bacterium]